MNASKNLVDSEGERFRATCAKASEILAQPSATLLSLFDQCRQSIPEDLIARAYPAPVAIMPDLETDIDHDEPTAISDAQNETVSRSARHDLVNS